MFEFEYLVLGRRFEELFGLRIAISDEAAVVGIVQAVAGGQGLHPRHQPDHLAVFAESPGKQWHAIEGVGIGSEPIDHLQAIELGSQADQATPGALTLAHELQVDDPGRAG